MNAQVSGVVVGVDTLDSSREAIRWGAAEASKRRVPLQLVHAIRPVATPESAILAGAFVWPTDIPMSTLREAAKEGLAQAETYARSVAPDVEVTTAVHEDDVARALTEVAGPHRLIVIGSRHLSAVRANLFGSVGTALAHASHSRFIVVRGDQGDHDQDRTAPIVVGVDPTSASAGVLEVAFEQASVHHRPLKAVIAWEHYFYAPHDRVLTDPAEIRAEAELWLAEATAGWQETYPDVTIERELVFEYPTTALVAESLSAALVVVGVGGRRLTRTLGSVAAGVLHHAACAVEVVPR